MNGNKDKRCCPFNHKRCIDTLCNMYDYDNRCCGFRTIMENTAVYLPPSTSSYEVIFPYGVDEMEPDEE